MSSWRTVSIEALSMAEKAILMVEDYLDEDGEPYGCDYFTALFEYDHESNPIRLVATDGGEPEDQTFRRDWSWVAGELNEAWEKGRWEGQ